LKLLVDIAHSLERHVGVEEGKDEGKEIAFVMA